MKNMFPSLCGSAAAIALAAILLEHGGGSGVAFSWEAQLLAGGGPAK